MSNRRYSDDAIYGSGITVEEESAEAYSSPSSDSIDYGWNGSSHSNSPPDLGVPYSENEILGNYRDAAAEELQYLDISVSEEGRTSPNNRRKQKRGWRSVDANYRQDIYPDMNSVPKSHYRSTSTPAYVYDPNYYPGAYFVPNSKYYGEWAQYPQGNVGQEPPQEFINEEELKLMVLNQIEYYFTADNLVSDLYLRQNMNELGFIGVDFLGTFNRVKILTTDVALIASALSMSQMLELNDSHQVRLRNGWENWILPTNGLEHIKEFSRYHEEDIYYQEVADSVGDVEMEVPPGSYQNESVPSIQNAGQRSGSQILEPPAVPNTSVLDGIQNASLMEQPEGIDLGKDADHASSTADPSSAPGAVEPVGESSKAVDLSLPVDGVDSSESWYAISQAKVEQPRADPGYEYIDLVNDQVNQYGLVGISPSDWLVDYSSYDSNDMICLNDKGGDEEDLENFFPSIDDLVIFNLKKDEENNRNDIVVFFNPNSLNLENLESNGNVGTEEIPRMKSFADFGDKFYYFHNEMAGFPQREKALSVKLSYFEERGFVYISYARFKTICLEKHGTADYPNSKDRMNCLYKFWSRFLIHFFKRKYYKEFKSYALEDFRRRDMDIGMNMLVDFYHAYLTPRRAPKKRIPYFLIEHFQHCVVTLMSRSKTYGLEMFKNFLETQTMYTKLKISTEVDDLLRTPAEDLKRWRRSVKTRTKQKHGNSRFANDHTPNGVPTLNHGFQDKNRRSVRIHAEKRRKN